MAALMIWEGRLGAMTEFAEAQLAAMRAAGNEMQQSFIRFQIVATKAGLMGGDALDDLVAFAHEDLPAPLASQAAAIATALGETDRVRALVSGLESQATTDDVRVPVTVARAHLKAADGRVADAIADLETLLLEFPQGADLHTHIGRLQHLNGNLDGAVASYDKTIAHTFALGGSTPVIIAKFHRASALVELGRTAEAREALDELLEQWANADTDFLLLEQARAMRAALPATN